MLFCFYAKEPFSSQCALVLLSVCLNRNSFSRNRNSHDSQKKSSAKRPRINRQLLEDGESRFIQSYSIFEAGLGCVPQSNKTAVELRTFSFLYSCHAYCHCYFVVRFLSMV